MNRLATVVLLLLSATLISGASQINWSWMLPGGDLKFDRSSLTSSKFCALTFDDGPDKLYTAEIGRILEREGVPGTFFVLGKKVADFPDVVTALVAEGHEIASHSWSHPDLKRSDGAKVDRELADTNTELASLGITPRWFRPPYGAYSKSTVSHASDHGLRTILWSVDPRDWSTPGVEVIVNRVLEGAHPGAIILLHSTNPQTVAALPWIIDGLRDDGYQLVTVSEWARLVSGAEPLAPPREAPLAQPSSPERQPPALPSAGSSAKYPDGPTALRVISNFSGSRELGLVLSRGSADRDLYSFSYSATQAAPMLEPAPETSGQLFAGISESAIEMPVPATPEPAPVPQDQPAAVETAVAHIHLQDLLAGNAAWEFADSIDATAFSESAAGPVIPSYYLIKSAGGGWSGSASINGLLAAGKFSGVVVASEFNLTGSLKGLSAPSVLYSVGHLDPASVVNLSRQDTSAVLRGCAAGFGSIFITVNPDDLADYREGGDPASIPFLREFLLLRCATAGLQAGPADLQDWFRLQDSVAAALFSGADRQVLAVRGNQPGSVLRRSGADGPALYVLRFTNTGEVQSAVLAGDALVIGDELVLVSDRPFVEP